jgi:hypothetical protein
MAANPNNPVILHHAGYANLKTGDLAEASACFQRAYRLSPGSPDAFYSLTGEGDVQVFCRETMNLASSGYTGRSRRSTNGL